MNRQCLWKKRRNPYKVWKREPHRNALSKQEYRPAQQNVQIKSLVDLKRRNVGETGGEKLFKYILPLFLLQYAKSQGVQPRAKVGEGSTRAWKKYPGQTKYRFKNGDRDHNRSKIAHKSECEYAKEQLFVSFSSVLIGLTSEQKSLQK